jgi:outer membrane protein TolC
MQAGAWFINPQLLMPVFNSRILKQDVDYQKLKAQQALFEYKKTVLEALEESENAIATFHYELEKGKELLKAQKAAQEAQVMTLDLYQRGFKSYLEVQRANQSLFKAEERLLENQGQVLIHYIALYKALGGEWNSKSDLEDNCSDTEEDELSKFINFN